MAVMKIHFKVILFILIVAGAFLTGYWLNSTGGKAGEERKILYYIDPMNPAFKSDKPGIAPCGMPLEPVYADKNGFTAGGPDPRVSLPPGTVRIAPEKQQLIGVKMMTVEKAPWTHTLRVLGRVTPDETRIYRLTAATSGWIQDVFPVTTGSLVRKDESLATVSFISTEFRTTLLAYFNLVNAGNASLPDNKAPGPTAPKSVAAINKKRTRELEKIRLTDRGASGSQVDWYRQTLFSYGISESQLEEIERVRKIPDSIDIRSPAAGFILSRNVSPGLRFDRGAEFFRIADLSRVWILADVFENEAAFFNPGMRVKMELPYQKKTLYARMSHVLPQFDPATRTLKVRLEADNPGYAMRPDMFVNVELPVSGPPAIIVPVDAVLDSGLKKTVFVDRGNGFFEPRQVETGRSLGERVEIARGLMPGEKIVVSGNFLMDSEARMQQAATGITGKIGRDPVCGMNIDEDSARAAGNYLEYRGQTYFFCDPREREDFRKEPERYLKSSPAQGSMPIPKSQGVQTKKHTSHDAMALPKSQDMKTMPQGHGAMPMAGQNEQAPVSGSQGAPSMPVMKDMDKFQAGPALPVQTMPGAKTGGMFTPALTSEVRRRMRPERRPDAQHVSTGTLQPGNCRVKRYVMPSGTQGPLPMPGAKTGGMFPPSTGAPARQMPGSDGSLMPPGSQGSAIVPGPEIKTPGGGQNHD